MSSALQFFTHTYLFPRIIFSLLIHNFQLDPAQISELAMDQINKLNSFFRISFGSNKLQIKLNSFFICIY